MYKKIIKSAIIPLKSSKIPEIIRVKVWWTGKEKQRVILNLSSSKSLIFSCYIFKHQQALLLAHWFPCFLPSRILVDSITVSSIRHPLNLFSFLLFRSKIKSIYSAISSNWVFSLANTPFIYFFLFYKFAIFLLVTLCHFALYSKNATYMYVLLMNIELKFFIYIYW